MANHIVVCSADQSGFFSFLHIVVLQDQFTNFRQNEIRIVFHFFHFIFFLCFTIFNFVIIAPEGPTIFLSNVSVTEVSLTKCSYKIDAKSILYGNNNFCKILHLFGSHTFSKDVFFAK